MYYTHFHYALENIDSTDDFHYVWMCYVFHGIVLLNLFHYMNLNTELNLNFD